ncbi:CoA transferase [Methylocapsa sp. S129]|uniref:CoA transferase n=1 Tax=Methylocapsa sp. S129 TaxID=1641869 RepID=UPI00131C5EC5|nr:CoA transferase [Methylocapsa sp. S129]
MTASADEGPLAGLQVVEMSRGVGAAYAGRLLATLGAETVLVEPPTGNPLRRDPPFLPGSESTSALFCYLAAGKKSVICDLATQVGRDDLDRLLGASDVFVCDLSLDDRTALGLDADAVRERHPTIVYVSLLPFGAVGPKARWDGEEINLIHAAGEGFLLPNGLSAEMFPDRPPLKIHGHFAEMQSGVVAAMGALAALLSDGNRGSHDGKQRRGEAVDISTQDSMLALGAFAVQRFGDGSLEHRLTRSFKYGGVLDCADGYVELLTLEDRQWTGLVELMDHPPWTADPALLDPLERSRRGREINIAIRAWAKMQRTSDLVARAQRLGVPMAKYGSPAEVLAGAQAQARDLFQTVDAPGFGPCSTLVAPFHLSGAALTLRGGAPNLGEHQSLVAARGSRQRPSIGIAQAW